MLGCDESRQTPIRIKRAAMTLPVALVALPPQKNVGAVACPRGIHIRMAANKSAPIRFWLTLRAIRFTANR
jgi:hypothetical protein